LFAGGGLVLDEIKQSHTCPTLVSIPACFIIYTCFVIPFVLHLLKRFDFLYFLFTGLAFMIALSGTLMQINGFQDCPKNISGTPMCYYSLLLFTLLIGLKIGYRQASKK